MREKEAGSRKQRVMVQKVESSWFRDVVEEEEQKKNIKEARVSKQGEGWRVDRCIPT